MSSAIADLKKNILYVPEELKAFQIELKTPEGRFLTLQDFLIKAKAHMSAAPDKVVEQKVPTALVGTMIGLATVSGHSLSDTSLQYLITGFMFGELFERLRNKRQLSVVATEFELSALEMDKVLSGESDAEEG